LLRKTKLYEKSFDSVSLVSLKNYLAVFGCSATRAQGFEFLCKSSQVLVFVVDALNYGGWFSKSASFSANLYSLLFFAYFSADAYVFWESACWTNFCHVAQLAKDCWRYLRFSISKYEFGRSILNEGQRVIEEVRMFRWTDTFVPFHRGCWEKRRILKARRHYAKVFVEEAIFLRLFCGCLVMV
jgi:hypothetical protein